MRDTEKEFERLKKLLLDRYYERSVIEEAIETRDYNPSTDNTEFRQIGTSHRFEENVFADSTHYLDLFFNQVADSIVLGEKKYLVDKMLAQESDPKFMTQFTYDNLQNLINEKFQTTEPSIIFMPLTLFSRVHLEWNMPPNRQILEVIDGHYRLNLIRFTPQLVWSNKYMPFENIVIASKQFGEWIAKSKVKDRIRVTLDGDTAIHAYSIFHFQVNDPQQVLKIDVNRAELDKERLDGLTRTSTE